MGSIVGTESLSRCGGMESSAQVEGLALSKSVSAGAPLVGGHRVRAHCWSGGSMGETKSLEV